MDRVVNQVNEEEIDLRELFTVLKENKWIILFITLLFVIGAFVFIYFSTPQYKTNGTLEVSSNSPATSNNDLLMQAMELYGGPNDIDTEAAIIKSRMMVEKTLDKVNFTKRFFIKKNLKSVEVLPQDFPFSVKVLKGENIEFIIQPLNNYEFKLIAKFFYNGEKKEVETTSKFNKLIKNEYFEIEVDKKEAFDLDTIYKVQILNKSDVANSIIQKLNVAPLSPKASILNIEFKDNIPIRAAEFVNTLMSVYINQSIKLKTKQADQTLEFIDSQLKVISKKLAESELALEEFKKEHKVVDLNLEAQSLMQKLNDLQTQLNQILLQENLIKFIEHKILSSKTTSLVSADILDDQVLANMISKLQQLLLKKQDLLIEYTPKYPEVIKVNEQIRTLKKMILNRIKNIKSALETKRKTLEKMFNKYSVLLESLPQNERKLIDLTREYQVNEKIYSYLLEKRAATALAKSSIISNNRIIDTALVPQEPFKPKKALIIIISLILGLIVGIIIAFLKEFLSTKIKSVEDIEKLTDIPIIGGVPHRKDKKRILRVIDNPKSSFSEAFRVIRTNIKFLSPTDSHVISVTSTVAGEGKTTISSNLAGIFSLANKKTIIVNLDMRKPTLHKVFDIQNDVGLSNVLVGENKIEEVIHKTKYNNLYVIPSGPTPPNPGELLQSENMHKVIEYLKDNFEIVIFDTPPIGLVVDAIDILLRCNVNLYVVRVNYSKKEFLKTANDLKYNKGVKGLGIVVNDIKMKKGGYGGYGGYGYGGYGYYDEG